MIGDILNEFNGVFGWTWKKTAKKTYLEPSREKQGHFTILVFSDAGFPYERERNRITKGESMVDFSIRDEKRAIFHTITWKSREQRRVAPSTALVETIAVTVEVFCALNVKDAFNNFQRQH